uniref:Uncharacterized protein n=1 Tax=Arundo donax TaxID=35708 RepID=A0A0A8YT17_ARUDO
MQNLNRKVAHRPISLHMTSTEQKNAYRGAGFTVDGATVLVHRFRPSRELESCNLL